MVSYISCRGVALTTLMAVLGRTYGETATCHVLYLPEGKSFDDSALFDKHKEAFFGYLNGRKKSSRAAEVNAACGEIHFDMLLPPHPQRRWFTSRPSQQYPDQPEFTDPTDQQLIYSLEYLFGNINRLADRVPLQSIFLVGVYSGAAMAIQTALLYPGILGGVLSFAGWIPLLNGAAHLTAENPDDWSRTRTPICEIETVWRGTDLLSITGLPQDRVSVVLSTSGFLKPSFCSARDEAGIWNNLMSMMTQPICGVLWAAPSRMGILHYKKRKRKQMEELLNGHGDSEASQKLRQVCGSRVQLELRLMSLESEREVSKAKPEMASSIPFYVELEGGYDRLNWGRISTHRIVVGGKSEGAQAVKRFVMENPAITRASAGMLLLNMPKATRRFDLNDPGVPVVSVNHAKKSKTAELNTKLLQGFSDLFWAVPRRCVVTLIVKEVSELLVMGNWAEAVREGAGDRRLLEKCNGEIEFVSLVESIFGGVSHRSRRESLIGGRVTRIVNLLRSRGSSSVVFIAQSLYDSLGSTIRSFDMQAMYVANPRVPSPDQLGEEPEVILRDCIIPLSLSWAWGGPKVPVPCRAREKSDTGTHEFFVAFHDAFNALVESTDAGEPLRRNCGETRFSLLLPPNEQTYWFDRESARQGLSDPGLENSLRDLSSSVNQIITEVPPEHVFLVGQETGAAMAVHFARLYPLRLGGVLAVDEWDSLQNVTPNIVETEGMEVTPVRMYRNSPRSEPPRLNVVGASFSRLESVTFFKAATLPRGIRVGDGLLTDLLMLLTRPLCGVIWLTTTTQPLAEDIRSVQRISHVLDDLLGHSAEVGAVEAVDRSLALECGSGVTYRTVQVPTSELKEIRDGKTPSSVSDILREYYELSVLHRIYPNRIVIGGSHGAEDAVFQIMHNFVYIYGKIAGVIRLVDKKKRRPPPGFEGQTAIPTRSIDFPGGRSSVKARAELETAFKEMLTSPPRQCSVVLVVRDTLEAEMFESWEEAVRKKAAERGYELDRKCEGVVVFKTVLRSIAQTVGGFVRLIEGYAQPNHTFILLRGAGASKAIAQRSALQRRGFRVVPLPALPTRGTRDQIVQASMGCLVAAAVNGPWLELRPPDSRHVGATAVD
ncbi:hypothetical protein FOZ60_000257 [Perkinsus olseni]|uniref:Uncharacterized protein n=1 Tax=Perkinsus olseni TaxID=32597 RepID=A0A7J6P2P4_PEROL|nr:hypothetical protein FOZ60_000257 [Perkinsus olseni]